MKFYEKIASALKLLLDPYIEVVIHDVKSGKIILLEGTLSGRKIGDDSLIDFAKLSKTIDQNPYSKMEFNGKLIKSISVFLAEDLLMCINFDISMFVQIEHLIKNFINIENKSTPTGLFNNDWQNKVSITVHKFIEEKNWHFEKLNNLQKKAIVIHLKELNAFEEKNAANYIAKILGISRASIFNYLREKNEN